jgi:general L-amino acid transport system permease protein
MTTLADPTPTAAPSDSIGVVQWLRTRLFSSVGNTILTLATLLLLWFALPPIANWFVFDAVWWAAAPEVCRAAQGACWAMIHEKHRLIIFGRYPYAEHWRPLIAMLVLIGLIGASTHRPFWRRELFAAWGAGLLVMAVLMWGGIFGLTFVETTLWGGLPLTLILTTVGIAVAFPWGVLLALGRQSQMPIIRTLSIVYIELIRGVPLISLLFMASFMFPLFMPSGVQISSLLRAQVAIILFAGAYLAEVVRGGLQAVPRGQVEAARSLGLGYWPTMWKIVLPQAIRMVIPGIVNSFISTFKDTSLVAIVSLTDLMLAARQAVGDPEWRAFGIEGYVFIGLIYLIFCYLMSRYSQRLEVQLNTGRKR